MDPKSNEKYHHRLKALMDEYAHLTYSLTKRFPREEIYGVTSQLRRAALSVVLNYVEGYARERDRVHQNFLEISYGSLKESKYLIEFSRKEGYISEEDCKTALQLEDSIGGMLYGTIRSVKTKE